jgi:hypothetical protein
MKRQRHITWNKREYVKIINEAGKMQNFNRNHYSNGKRNMSFINMLRNRWTILLHHAVINKAQRRRAVFKYNDETFTDARPLVQNNIHVHVKQILCYLLVSGAPPLFIHFIVIKITVETLNIFCVKKTTNKTQNL